MKPLKNHKCPCGFIYEPDKENPAPGINPETPFEDLPEDWLCPFCGYEKIYFKEIIGKHAPFKDNSKK